MMTDSKTNTIIRLTEALTPLVKRDRFVNSSTTGSMIAANRRAAIKGVKSGSTNLAAI
jgi:methylglyoxal synthase